MDNIEAAIMWRSYKKHDISQLQILAELNACSAEQMRDRLMQAGIGACELPRAKRKKEEETEMPEEDVKTEAKTESPVCGTQNRAKDFVDHVNSVILKLVEDEVDHVAGFEGDKAEAMINICAYFNMRDKLLEGMKND